jgi:hypothetical protein
VAEGPNATIDVTPPIEPDVRIEYITEDYMVNLMGDTYSNIEVVEFENPITIAGVEPYPLCSRVTGLQAAKTKPFVTILCFFQSKVRIVSSK